MTEIETDGCLGGAMATKSHAQLILWTLIGMFNGGGLLTGSRFALCSSPGGGVSL